MSDGRMTWRYNCAVDPRLLRMGLWSPDERMAPPDAINVQVTRLWIPTRGGMGPFVYLVVEGTAERRPGDFPVWLNDPEVEASQPQTRKTPPPPPNRHPGESRTPPADITPPRGQRHDGTWRLKCDECRVSYTRKEWWVKAFTTCNKCGNSMRIVLRTPQTTTEPVRREYSGLNVDRIMQLERARHRRTLRMTDEDAWRMQCWNGTINDASGEDMPSGFSVAPVDRFYAQQTAPFRHTAGRLWPYGRIRPTIRTWNDGKRRRTGYWLVH